MRRWEVLVWGAAIFDRHDEKMRSSRFGGCQLYHNRDPLNENFSSSHHVYQKWKPPQTRTSHLLIKSNLKGRDNENFSYSHQVNWSLKPPKRELLIFSSSQILKGEIMRTSHILIKLIEAWSPPNENFSSSHHVYQKCQPPKRELLILSSSQILKGEIMRTFHNLIKLIEGWSPPNESFSSCLSKVAAPQTRTPHLLIMSIKNGSPPNENFSSSHQVKSERER